MLRHSGLPRLRTSGADFPGADRFPEPVSHAKALRRSPERSAQAPDHFLIGDFYTGIQIGNRFVGILTKPADLASHWKLSVHFRESAHMLPISHSLSNPSLVEDAHFVQQR